jgi:uncharacterized protein (TIGR02145 family)
MMSVASVNVNAQVRIGGTDDPNQSAILDLNASDATKNGTLGLVLPRVELTSTTSSAPLEAHVEGMTVYNTATVDDVTPGTYYNDGERWIRIGGGSLISAATAGRGLERSGSGTEANPYTLGIIDGGVTSVMIANGAVAAAKLHAMDATNGQVLKYNGSAWAPAGVAPVITVQPKAFSWSRLREINADPNGPTTATIAALSVTASGPGTLTYQWYQKSANRNAPDTKLNGATNATYSPVVTAWGMQSYYCVVGNGTGSVVSAIAEVAIGCGAKSTDGAWLKFMCYNLGTNITSGSSANPFTFTANDTTILGKFYQWGRPGANHRATNDTTNFTTNWAFPYDWVIPHGYSKPITASYHQIDVLWLSQRSGSSNSPCPAGWHVPSQSAFGAIFKGTADTDVPDNAIANTWTATGTWAYDGTGNGGYAIKPDGITTTLFFPSAGFRYNSSGTLSSVGLNGSFWSSTTAGTMAFYLCIYGDRVFPAYSNYRGHGLSVRCISE